MKKFSRYYAIDKTINFCMLLYKKNFEHKSDRATKMENLNTETQNFYFKIFLLRQHKNCLSYSIN